MNRKKEESVRHLPPGKLNNIRQLFEDGESGMEGRPVPPARPQQPPIRNKSPAPAIRGVTHPKIPPRLYGKEEVSSSAAPSCDTNRGIANARDESNSLQQPVLVVETRGRVSPTVNRRIVSLINTASSSQSPSLNTSNNNNINNSSNANVRRQSSSEDGTYHPSPSTSIAKRISHLTAGAEKSKNENLSNKNDSKVESTPDFYSKINKINKKNPEVEIRNKKQNETPSGRNSPLVRREAVRKTTDDRRNTIASFQSEDDSDDGGTGVSVLSRTKMFDQNPQKSGNKPPPPRKPEAVKRQFSLRTSKETSPPLIHDSKNVNVKSTAPQPMETVGGEEELYDIPWENKKSSNVEKLKKMAMRNSSDIASFDSTVAKNPPKPPPLSQKPSLPSTPPPRLSHLTSKTSDVSSSSSSPKKTPLSARPSEPPPPKPPLEAHHSKPPTEPPPKPPIEAPAKPWSNHKPTEPTLPAKPNVAAPPKPPRTHAHDAYLKGKVLVPEPNQNINEDPYKKRSVEVDSYSKQTEEKENECSSSMSIQDRISKMNKEQNSSNHSDDNHDNTDVTYRHRPPTRPPPPKRRPNSSGNPIPGEGPIVIPIVPKHQRLSRQKSAQPPSPQTEQPRNPMDQLPPAPPGKPITKFPLRKSLSSECVYQARSHSQDDYDEYEEYEVMPSQMTKSSYETEYEAVIDPDGYAVPNEFMKLAVRKQNSDSLFYGDGECPGRFLTKLEGFGPKNDANDAPWSPHKCKAGAGVGTGGGVGSPGNRLQLRPRQDASPGFGSSTLRRDQCLDKVAKKKMLIVKQKINQAYADVDFLFTPPSDHVANEEAEENDDVPELKEVVVDQLVLKKRIEHCSSIRRMSRMSMKKSKEYMTAIYPQLFEYCLVVGLRALTNNPGYEPYVIHKFPENVSSNLSVTSFCFPDASIFKPGSMTSVSESYSFVMTYADGSRVYGYCRRVQLTDQSLPEVICIISPIDAFNMYNTLLNEIETRRRTSLDLASEVIAASFGRPLPKPGKVCHIRTLDENGEMETIFLNRPSDNRLADVNYDSPLCSLGTDKLVKVFSAMLMERRIILCSSNLSLLTETIHALCALLYPFQWQHVYIPILPIEMLDVVCAPMPYIVGILSAFLPQVFQMEMEEVFVVDLDKKSILRSLGDEASLIPRKIQRALKTAINMCKIDNEARNAQWLMVAEAFLRMFIELIGHFGSHVCSQQDGNRIFQKEGFIVELVSKEVRQFLEWFTETQMFEVFIVNHVEKSDWGSCDLFMQRLQDYRDSREESRRRKGLGAKVKNFGKALKTKLAKD